MEDGHRRRRTAAVCIPTHNATRRRTPTRWSSRGAGPCRARRHLKPLLFHELGAQEKKPAGNVFIEPERSCYARSDIELDASTCCDAVYRETGLRPEKLSEDPDEYDYFDCLGDELKDNHSYDGGDKTDEDETDGDTSHEGRYN
ncbi:hypothetical protein U9M48_003181 [Paspalum notatum var. saurae]|uniref:Uncharacterized protein n=1 Tax=Paspalum notatum var. saurae TaxID=547442 RepID=A0AAQ3SDV6_PASNO